MNLETKYELLNYDESPKNTFCNAKSVHVTSERERVIATDLLVDIALSDVVKRAHYAQHPATVPVYAVDLVAEVV